MLVAIHLANYGSCRILSGDALKELWAREASIADEEKLSVDADPELKDARPHEHKAYETRGICRRQDRGTWPALGRRRGVICV